MGRIFPVSVFRQVVDELDIAAGYAYGDRRRARTS